MYKPTNQVKHLQKVMTHINIIRVVCRLFNDRLDSGIFGSISQAEIENHDASKFSKVEIKGYVKQFFTDDKNSPEWQPALMHHYKNNAHHWQYWLDGFEQPYTEQQCKPLDMPSDQILIMVSDWIAAGLQYQGSADISGWLNDNLLTGKIILSDETSDMVSDIILAVGFRNSENGFYLFKDSFVSNVKMANGAITWL